MNKEYEIPKFDFSVLRKLRKREGLTIGDVSEKSGVSTAVISKLERNQTTAELETLFKVGRVFGMTATDLIAMAESPLAHLIRADSYTSDGFHFQKIRYSNVSCFFGIAKKGAKVRKPEIHHDEYEICWILEGKVKLTLFHEVHELEVGDSLQFDAIQEHSYEALANSKVMILHLRKGKRF